MYLNIRCNRWRQKKIETKGHVHALGLAACSLAAQVQLGSSEKLRPYLNSEPKILGCHIGYYIGVSSRSVRIVILKQITEVLSTPRDEFTKPN
jgi:hypothetical protein